MITRAELQRIAGREKIGLGVLEKDYVITEALRGISAVGLIGQTFIFKGGTALRKVYFPQWRYSEDLDFTVTDAFPRADLQSYLEQWYGAVEANTGIRLATRDLHRPDGFARLRMQFQGPLGQPATIFADLTFDEPVLVTPVRRALLVQPFALPPATVLAYSLEELAAEKIRSILERGKSRDYYDVWRLLRDHTDSLDLPLTRALYARKCAHKGLSNTGIDALLSSGRLAEAERYWDAGLARQLGDLPPFRAAADELRVALGKALQPRGRVLGD